MPALLRDDVLFKFVQRRLVFAEDRLINSEGIAEEVYYLMRSRLEDKPNKTFFVDHVRELLSTYGKRLMLPDSQDTLSQELHSFYTQSVISFSDIDKGSFSQRVDEADAEGDDDADAMMLLGSTR